MKAKILIDDAGQRFKKGDIGEVSEETGIYPYSILLPGLVQIPDFLGGGWAPRRYYFNNSEIRITE